MSSPAFGGVAAIAGIGQTEFSRHAGRSELQLACESITAALTDAGLQAADVDGLVSYTVDPVEETELVRSVGFQEIAFSSRIPYGGGGSMGVLLHAASAVASGAADVVVGYRAIRARSGASRFGGAKSPRVRPRRTRARPRCSGACRYGVLTPASWMALNATRYMHEFGVDQRRLRSRGRATARVRGHQPERLGLRAADHARGPPGVALDRRAVHPPLRLLPGDRRLGRARRHLGRARRRPAARAGRIAAARGAGLFEQEIATDHYRPDLSVMDGSVVLAARLFDEFGFRARRYRRGDDLRRVLADLAHAARSAGLLRSGRGQGLHRATATSHSTARCRATPTAASSARGTSTGSTWCSKRRASSAGPR